MAGHDSATEHVDFSPDGRHLASVGKNDTLRFREPASGRQVGEPVDITMVGDIAFIEFSADGRRVFLAAKNMPTDGGSSSVGGGICQVPAPAAWADALCEKLTTNPNQEQWNEWISSDPEIAPHCVVPERAHRTVRALAERWRIEHVDFRSVPVVSHGCEEAVGACRAALAPLVAQDDGVTA